VLLDPFTFPTGITSIHLPFATAVIQLPLDVVPCTIRVVPSGIHIRHLPAFPLSLGRSTPSIMSYLFP